MPSSAANTPHHQARQDQEAAMCCAARLVMTSQPASTTMMVMKAVSSTNHSEMPSTRVVVDVEGFDPGRLLDELHRGRLGVETGVQRNGDEEARDRTDQRQPAGEPGRSSRPTASTSRPNTIGTKIASVSQGKCWMPSRLPSLGNQHKESHQRHDADDHRERVVIDEAGLQVAADRETQPTTRALPLTSRPSIRPRSPVCHRPRQAGSARDDLLVDPVHEVLVLGDLVRPTGWT